MTTGAHVDLVQVGTATVDLIGHPFVATGIALPPAGADALVLRVDAPESLGGTATTAVFGEQRLLSLERAAANDGPTDANSLPLEDLSIVAFSGSVATVIGLSAATDEMPFGELLMGGVHTGGRVTVTLWHMEPADVDLDALAASLSERVLPAPTPTKAGFAVRLNAEGTAYELVEDGGGGAGESTSVYATPEQYKARSGAGTDIADTLLTEILTAASRHIDRKLRVVPGHFAPTANATRVFRGAGGNVLRLRDAGGLSHGLRSVVDGGIRPDFDLTGRYDGYAWDFDDVWLWGLPENAAERGEPYSELELRPLQSAPLTIWPYDGGAVRIEGAWGWASTPNPIRELTIMIARDFRDSQRGGLAARVADFDESLVYRNDTWRLWRAVEREYGHRPPKARTRSR